MQSTAWMALLDFTSRRIRLIRTLGHEFWFLHLLPSTHPTITKMWQPWVALGVWIYCSKHTALYSLGLILTIFSYGHGTHFLHCACNCAQPGTDTGLTNVFYPTVFNVFLKHSYQCFLRHQGGGAFRTSCDSWQKVPDAQRGCWMYWRQQLLDTTNLKIEIDLEIPRLKSFFEDCSLGIAFVKTTLMEIKPT